jgi:formylglycine-generating enzyme required for sulfatase activity
VHGQPDPRCCAPSRAPTEAEYPPAPSVPAQRREAPPTEETVGLPGGTFTIGSDDLLAYPEDGEVAREVEVSPFMIDRGAVSNRNFEQFVAATGYVTEAERLGWSFVFADLLPDDFPPTRGVAAAPWWRQVPSADWRRPGGPHSDLENREDHPVVHVSWADAVSYCIWAGKRLPTETEWEFAARGGLEGRIFPWGDELEPEGEHHMNVWQGTFPDHNTKADGYYGTCPIDWFPPNGYGLHNTTGNVWEWTADWFDPAFRPHDRRRDPTGPPDGSHRVQKGGSYLCHASYCRRYRIAARQGNTPESAAGNVGFRCAADIEP